MLKILPCLILMLLSSCSNYNSAFECKLGTGVNCVSVSKINHMVDDGSLNKIEANSSVFVPGNYKVKKEIIKVAQQIPFPLVLPNNLHNSNVARIPETTLRIWVAPYVSAKDGYIEAQYVHEILEKGAWMEQRE